MERLFNYTCVGRFKSVGRAFRRGLISANGTIYSKRPFNNRSNKNGTRPFNELKKNAYVEYRRHLQEGELQ
jgi:hypothetical protein